jgi:hypothetical protein
MIGRRRPPVERRGPGRFVVGLDPEDREALGRFLVELQAMLDAAEPGDPRLRRLHPAAHHDDPEREAEWQRLMHEELTQSRRADITVAASVLAGSPDETLDEARMLAWSRALNGLRLVLGTLLDVSEEDDWDDLDPDDPIAPRVHLYGYLGWLMEWTVTALSADLDH